MSRINLHTWTENEVNYLKEIAYGRSRSEICQMMIDKFDYPFTVSQVVGAMKNRKISTGRTGRFEKGNVPYSAGTKGVVKPNSGSFKKGEIPPNHRPVGSERLNVEGYYEVKVAEPNVWRHKHRVIWEKVNGKIPDDHVLLFSNGKRDDIRVDNLLLIKRELLLIMAREKLIMPEKELTEVGVNIATVINKLEELKRTEK